MGKWVAVGTVSELHPHPHWLSPVVPSLGFPEGLHAVYGLLKSMMAAAPSPRACVGHRAALLWLGFCQPTVPVRLSGLVGAEQASALPLIDPKWERVYYSTDAVCMLGKHRPGGPKTVGGFFW